MWPLRGVVAAGILTVWNLGPIGRPGGSELTSQAPHLDSIAVLIEAERSDFSHPLRQVVRDSASLADLWRRAGIKRPPPHVDFRHEDIIVAALGREPDEGYLIKVREVTSTDTAVIVSLDLREPGPHCAVAATETSPMTFVRHRRPKSGGANLPVQFAERRVTLGCRP